MGGGGSGGGGPTTSTTNTSNLPTYVQPYVETMLGTAQQQIYNYDPSGNVSGFKPYVPYGATVDSSGNITNSAQDQAQSAVAPFSPLQQQAQQGVAGLQVPGQYGAATGATAYGTANAMNMANQANPQDFQNQVGQYMNPYLQQSLQPSLDLLNQQYGIAGLGTTGIAGLGLYNAMGGSSGSTSTSDVRTKQNLVLVGTLPMGVNVYHFEYKPPFKAECGEGWYKGVMAQEVQKVMPEAVVEMDNGFLGVKYDMLGIKMERV